MTAKRIRYERIIWAMRITIRVTLVAALIGTFVPGELGRAASAAAVGFIIAAPLVRVAWLAYRWWRWGDRAFASVAASLLLIVATGTAVATLTR